jgi:hypothetical protein
MEAERRARADWMQVEKTAEEHEEQQWEQDEVERRGRSERPPFEPGKKAA